MTQYRNDRGRESNWLDEWEQGIGHRGSSFTDIDAVTHDEHTQRYLYRELKGPYEPPINRGQWRFLQAKAKEARTTCWYLRRRLDGRINWYDFSTHERAVFSREEYRARFRAWWNPRPLTATSIDRALEQVGRDALGIRYVDGQAQYDLHR